MKKIIQIDAMPLNENVYPSIFALCEDGTLYVKSYFKDGAPTKWFEIHGIPDKDEEDEEDDESNPV